MIRPISKTRPAAFLNDFQVLKGRCPKTMQNFGEPVSAPHEANLLIRDDAKKLKAGETALYVVHQRSENRILRIVERPLTKTSRLPSTQPGFRPTLANAA